MTAATYSATSSPATPTPAVLGACAAAARLRRLLLTHLDLSDAQVADLRRVDVEPDTGGITLYTTRAGHPMDPVTITVPKWLCRELDAHLNTYVQPDLMARLFPASTGGQPASLAA